MVELEHGTLDIALREDDNGRDQVTLSLGTRQCEIGLTPHQARQLATELIMAVNRAEVRNNLRRSQNLVRPAEPPVRLRTSFG